MNRGGRAVLRQRGGRLRPLAVVAAIVLSVIAAYLLRDRLPLVPAIDRWVEDTLFRLRGPAAPHPAVVLVTLTEADLQLLGRWPPSRARLAEAVQRLTAAGATAIVLDLLLDAPEPATAGGGDGDAELEAALRHAGRVVLPFGFVYRADAANAFEVTPALAAAALPVVRDRGEGIGEAARHPLGLLLPLERFLNAARPAHATFHPDAGGTPRRFPLATRFGGAWFASVPLEAVRLHLGLAADAIVLEPGRRIWLGGRELSVDLANAVRPDWRGSSASFDRLAFTDLLAGRVPAAQLAGRIVLVGADIVGLGDRHVTPFDPGLPGVEVLATVIDGLLAGRFLRDTPLVDLAALLFAAVLAVGLAAIPRTAVAVGLLVLTVSGWWLAVAAAFATAGLLPDAVLPTLALAGGTLATRALARPGRDKQAVSGGNPLPAAILFTDLAGFTALGERLGGPGMAALLRRLHGIIETCVHRRGGAIVEWTGDGALAVFGLVGEGPRAAVDALACGRELLRQLDKEATAGREALVCRVGIHFGPVTLAGIGGHESQRASVIGDAVNVASRLEQLNKQFESRIAISDAVAEAVRACGESRLLDGFEPQPPQRLRGRERPVGVWTLR